MNACDDGQDQWDANAIFVCNDCHGELTKYILLDDYTETKNSAQVTCKDVFHTDLASIHSDFDMDEAFIIGDLGNNQSNYNADEIYIGLVSQSNSWSWTDGTSFDYGTNINGGVYPWKSSEPNNNANCVRLDELSNYEWKDIGCGGSAMGLCNMPSELCDQSDWDVVVGNAGTWTTKPCQVVTSNADNMAIISNKRWYNGNDRFVVEYTYTINNIGVASNGGIIIHFDTSCNHYYYIGISPSDSTIFFAEVFNDNMNILNSASLGFTYQSGIFYQLKTEIVNGDTFTISVNDNVRLSSITSNLFSNSGLNEIGYIGIKNLQSSITAKSLFISGDIVFKTNPDITSWFSSCPTPEPTSIITTTTTTLQPSSSPTVTCYPKGPCDDGYMDTSDGTSKIGPVAQIVWGATIEQIIAVNVYVNQYSIAHTHPPQLLHHQHHIQHLH